MRNFRPNIAALVTFAILAASCSPRPGGPLAVAQSPPMPPVVVPVDPTPAPPDPPKPPKPDAPGITIPAQTAIDQRLIATFCPPPGLENKEAIWRFFEVAKDGWMRPVVIDALIDSGGQRAFLWPKPGNYRAEVICQGTVWTADFTRGDPPPPEPSKTLKELAGKDGPALSAIYAELATATDSYGLVKVFTAVAAQRLTPFATNPAVLEVTKRFAALGAPDAKLDGPQLKALLAAVVTELGAPGPAPEPTVKATAATYVYEKDETAIPVGVQTGLNRLNREKKILATVFEDDTVDGSGEVPNQYKVPLAEAKKAGLPALVFTNGEAVLTVIKAPTTEAQVLEAAQ